MTRSYPHLRLEFEVESSSGIAVATAWYSTRDGFATSQRWEGSSNQARIGPPIDVHVIPRDFKAVAKACAAREQCVLTLPSEQPIALAVSATSSSSQ